MEIIINTIIALAVLGAIFKGMDLFVKYNDKHHPEWRDNAARPA